jgi:transcriptional regulator with XRE-family HTH domain
VTPAQCRAARGLLGWTQARLAKAAHIGISTIYDFERERREVHPDSVAKMQKSFEASGIAFLNGKRPGVRLRGK